MKTNKKLVNLYQITNKQRNLYDYIRSILNRTHSMFEYDGLPDTLKSSILEDQMQENGYTVIFKYQNNNFGSYTLGYYSILNCVKY